MAVVQTQDQVRAHHQDYCYYKVEKVLVQTAAEPMSDTVAKLKGVKFTLKPALEKNNL